MNLYEIAREYWQKTVRIITESGNSYVGQLISYTPEEDNEPESESILISISDNIAVELFEHEIQSIAQLDE